MKLGLSIGYSGAQLALPVELVQHAEYLGYDSVWTAEVYGSDAMTPLAYLAAKTSRIKLATGIIQLAARTPANAAMQAATIDALAGGGRVIVGLGVSGPQIVEGWYGQPWGRPYYHLKDYAEIMRKIWRREELLTHAGKALNLPYCGPGALGIGKPLRSILHMNRDIPIVMGTGAKSTIRLTGEVADGWLPLNLGPRDLAQATVWLDEGIARAGGGKRRKDFEIYAEVPVMVDDDVKRAFYKLKAETALYVGGMGHRDLNFHHQLMTRKGYGEAADKIQEHFLAGRRGDAIEAVPDEWVDNKSLVGTPARIKERYKDWARSGATHLILQSPDRKALDLMAEIVTA